MTNHDTMIFELDGHEYIELHKLLKLTGLCGSGGEAKTLIANGLVRVNDAIETRKRCKLRAGQRVQFNQHEVIIQA